MTFPPLHAVAPRRGVLKCTTMVRRMFVAVLVGITVSVFVALYLFQMKQRAIPYTGGNIPLSSLQDNSPSHMIKISSPAFSNNDFIPPRYTCDGENILPPLEIRGIPSDAASVAVIVDDPDAPGGVWNHWSVWNIPVQPVVRLNNTSILQEAREGITDFGTKGYGGPCPPRGTGVHRYFFKVYALPKGFVLSADAPIEDIRATIEDNAIDYGELIGLYTHNK